MFTGVPIFVEKVILPSIAATIVVVAWTNPLGLGLGQRLSFVFVALLLAYWASSWLHSHNQGASAGSPRDQDLGRPVVGNIALRFGRAILDVATNYQIYIVALAALGIMTYPDISRWISSFANPSPTITPAGDIAGKLSSLTSERDDALKKLTTMTAERDKAIGDRVAANQQGDLLAANQRNMTAACTLDIMNRLKRNPKSRNIPKTLVILAPQTNITVQQDLRVIVIYFANSLPPDSVSSQPISIVEPPDTQMHLEVQKLNGSGVKGITIHGNGPVAEAFADAFGAALPTQTHTATLEGADDLLAYYHREDIRLADYISIVWVEISDLQRGPADKPLC